MKLIEALDVDDAVLDNINEQFVNIAVDNDIRTHSFQEGRGIAGMKGKYEKVVSDFSSKMGIPKVEIVESIDADHVQMARCLSKSDEVYRSVAGVLQQFMQNRGINVVKTGYREDDNFSTTQSSAPTYRSKPAMELTDCGATQPQLSPTMFKGSNPNSAGESISSAYSYLPITRNRWFIGRTRKLEELEARYFKGEGCQKLALVGLGGIGKTQIALEFAHRVKQHRPGYSVFWISAVSRASFEQSYKEIAKRCAIPLHSQNEDIKDSVKQFLDSVLAGRWLIIVDNSDDEDVLFGTGSEQDGVIDYVPESENGLMLFTTRHRETAVSLARNNIVTVEAMDEDEAEAFLSNSLANEQLPRDTQILKTLLSELTYLPLAIAQAAAYMTAMQISVQDYLRLLRNTEEDTVSLLSREFRDNTRYKGSKNSIAATWLVSFNQIRQVHPIAADLLSFMSCIECKAIPRSILPSVVSEEGMVYAIGKLRAYDFVAERGDGDSYDMHRLVHLAIKAWIDKEGEMQRVIDKVAEHLRIRLSAANQDNRSEWRHYLPHAIRFLRNTEDWQDLERYTLCMLVGRCLRIDCQLSEAIELLQESLSWMKEHLEEHAQRRLEAQEELAAAYQYNGQLLMSIQLLEEVCSVQSRTLEPDDISRLNSQHDLAQVYRLDGRFDKSIEMLEEIVETESKIFEDGSIGRLGSQHELAAAYYVNGQDELAMEMLEKAIAVYEHKSSEKDELLYLALRGVLASIYCANGQPDWAIEILELDLGVLKRRSYREDDFYLLEALHGLALAYREYGYVEEAIGLFEEVLAIQNKSRRRDHHHRLSTQHELAKAYKEDGQLEKAIELFEEVHAIEKASLRQDHPSRLLRQQVLGKTYRDVGEMRKAIDVLEEVVTFGKHSLKGHQCSQLVAKYDLGMAYADVGDKKKGIELFEEIVAADEDELVENYLGKTNCQLKLATFYDRDGQHQKAIDLFETIMAAQRKSARKDYLYLMTQHECALSYRANGQLDKGLELLEHVVAVAKDNKDKDYTNQDVWFSDLDNMRAARSRE